MRSPERTLLPTNWVIVLAGGAIGAVMLQGAGPLRIGGGAIGLAALVLSIFLWFQPGGGLV